MSQEIKGFTSRYNVKRLVYYEQHEDASVAIQREKQLKKWNRAWKIRLIEKHNPRWKVGRNAIPTYNSSVQHTKTTQWEIRKMDARQHRAGMTTKPNVIPEISDRLGRHAVWRRIQKSKRILNWTPD